VKAARAPLHSLIVDQALATDEGAPVGAVPRTVEVAEIYRVHADFLWRSLQRLGVRDADLEDTVQEVLVVVHRRRHSFNFECRLTTWLFGICLRIASRHRRRAHFRWERTADILPDQVDPTTPEDRLVEQRDMAHLARILSTLSLEHRAVFVMFEVEGESCQTIAELFGVPVGTIYSRLHNARSQVEKAISRERRASREGSLR
jgi:RNA polymerase sigma-70 factor (ECF subfamily)